MVCKHSGGPGIRKQRRVGLKNNEAGRGVCLDDAETRIGDDKVPTDANRLGEAAHGGEDSFERIWQPGNKHAFNLCPGLRMDAVADSTEIFAERHGFAQFPGFCIHSGTKAANSLVEVVDWKRARRAETVNHARNKRTGFIGEGQDTKGVGRGWLNGARVGSLLHKSRDDVAVEAAQQIFHIGFRGRAAVYLPRVMIAAEKKNTLARARPMGAEYDCLPIAGPLLQRCEGCARNSFRHGKCTASGKDSDNPGMGNGIGGENLGEHQLIADDGIQKTIHPVTSQGVGEVGYVELVAIAFEFVKRSIAGPEAHPKCPQAASPWNACATERLTLNFAEESNPATQGKV